MKNYLKLNTKNSDFENCEDKLAKMDKNASSQKTNHFQISSSNQQTIAMKKVNSRKIYIPVNCKLNKTKETMRVIAKNLTKKLFSEKLPKTNQSERHNEQKLKKDRSEQKRNKKHSCAKIFDKSPKLF